MERHSRALDACHSATERPLGWDEPEPDPRLDTAGCVFDSVLTRIKYFEQALHENGGRPFCLQGATPSDDLKRAEEYRFVVNDQAILSMKYIAQGLYEELAAGGDLGRELAAAIVASHGLSINTPDWRHAPEPAREGGGHE